MDINSDPPWTIAPGAAFASIRVRTWTAFSDLVETHFLDWSEYLFRGQRCIEWLLLSKFDREVNKGAELLAKTDPVAELDSADRDLVVQAVEGRGRPALPERKELLKEHLDWFKGARNSVPKSHCRSSCVDPQIADLA